MFEIRVEYLHAVVNEINIIYGSMKQYAEQGIGFTKDKLEERENLTYFQRNSPSSKNEKGETQ